MSTEQYPSPLLRPCGSPLFGMPVPETTTVWCKSRSGEGDGAPIGFRLLSGLRSTFGYSSFFPPFLCSSSSFFFPFLFNLGNTFYPAGEVFGRGGGMADIFLRTSGLLVQSKMLSKTKDWATAISLRSF